MIDLTPIYNAQEYLRALKYNVWVDFNSIDPGIFDEVFDLIDENYLCKYLFSDDGSKFKKVH